MMRLRELVPADLGPLEEPDDLVLLFGSPAFVYSNLLRTGYNWLRAVVLRRDPRFYSHQFHHEWSYIRTRLEIFSRESGHGRPAELVHFARAYLRKRRAARLKHCGV
jgi:GMP synthase-like glutamine amidotransferase